MKIAVIGCGNMGGAIARSLAMDAEFSKDNVISVSNRTQAKLDALKSQFPCVEISTDNKEVVKDADMVVFAVKPWLLETVAKEVRDEMNASQIVISVVAGKTFEELAGLFTIDSKQCPLFRVIPNTAIAIGQSMTVISQSGATDEQEQLVQSLFDKSGKTLLVEERLMNPAMALCSCGTAYALRYIRASVEGGVELGLTPKQAQMLVGQTMVGAAGLLEANDSHPEAEIDKVTTPGGLTIKGLNKMEACGFTNAVIEGLKASIK